MALRVWLPLNGSLENQGISGIVPTMMGSVPLTETGKIGKCAYFSNNPANCVYMDGLQQINNFSWTCWFKCVGEGSAAYQFLLSEGRDCVQYGVNLRLTKEGTGLFAEVGANSAVVRTSTKTIELNKWYHAAMTINSTELKLYVDGELFNTKTLTLVPNYEQSNNKFVIGKMAHGYTGTGSYFPFNGYVNDVRIYDHCLSPLEVKEISQGLVLHYKLDNQYTESTINYLSGKSEQFVGIWGSYGFGSRGEISDGGIAPALSGQTALVTNKIEDTTNVATEMATTFYSNQSTIMNNGDTFTASCYIKGKGSTIGKRCQIHIYNTNGTNTVSTGTQYTLTDEWQRVTHTMTWTHETASNNQGNCYIVGYISSGEGFYVSNWQVEKGNHATPYVASSRETAGICDSSGYGYNGTITGTLITQQNSDRYNVSSYFNGSSYITVPNPWKNGSIITEFTHTAWIKWNSNCSTSAGIHSIAGSNNFFRFSLGKANKLWAYGLRSSLDGGTTSAAGLGQYGSATSLVNGQWYFIAVTFKDGVCKCYCDGELVGTVDNSATYPALKSTIDNLYIGSYNVGSEPAIGNVADSRIYCTALSEEDILTLYHTSAHVDNLQNMHSFEFNEQLTQNVISDWTDVNLISMNGWSGSKSYNSNYNYLVLTATNGWRTFAWSTGGLTSQPCVFEFDYYLADNTNLSSTGIFIINRDTVEYGVPLMQLDTTLNKWNHCKFETNSALKYLGINIRGTDNTGNSVILYVRNVSINPSSISGTNRISKNGIFFNNAMYENGKILNTATSGTFTPTNINNSTTNYAVIDFREYSSLGKDLKAHIEADVEWTAFTGSGDGTFRGLWFQGANYQINSGSVWAGTNYICSALNSQYSLQNETKLSTAGTYHYNTTTTIPASWFETYERSNFGMRCDYSDGTGTFKIKNFKVTISEDSNARVTKDAIFANNFIEK